VVTVSVGVVVTVGVVVVVAVTVTVAVVVMVEVAVTLGVVVAVGVGVGYHQLPLHQIKTKRQKAGKLPAHKLSKIADVETWAGLTQSPAVFSSAQMFIVAGPLAA
jgi:hypothetical protein